MADFLFIYRGGDHDLEDMSPEVMQQVMQKWMDWIGAGTEAGWMLDGGDALKPTGRVVRPDGKVTDGPFAESKELVGGYSMIRADSADQACELARGCPHLVSGGTVEVRELAKVGGEPS